MRTLSNGQVKRVAERSRAIGDATRVRILVALARGERPVGVLAKLLHCEPSMMSKHLQVLLHAGLVERRRDASMAIYSIASPHLLDWCHYLATDLGIAPTKSGRART